MRPATDKIYLGDAVYAAWDGYHVVLTTEDGQRVTNKILIDDKVWSALIDYVDALKEKAARLISDEREQL